MGENMHIIRREAGTTLRGKKRNVKDKVNELATNGKKVKYRFRGVNRCR
jgi:hypothetical protein